MSWTFNCCGRKRVNKIYSRSRSQSRSRSRYYEDTRNQNWVTSDVPGCSIIGTTSNIRHSVSQVYIPNVIELFLLPCEAMFWWNFFFEIFRILYKFSTFITRDGASYQPVVYHTCSGVRTLCLITFLIKLIQFFWFYAIFYFF